MVVKHGFWEIREWINESRKSVIRNTDPPSRHANPHCATVEKDTQIRERGGRTAGKGKKEKRKKGKKEVIADYLLSCGWGIGRTQTLGLGLGLGCMHYAMCIVLPRISGRSSGDWS